jgi:DNA-binding transcriptional ArsR family regulator
MALKAWRQGEPRSPEAEYYKVLFRDLYSVMEIMRACGVAVELGKDFYADPLTFEGQRLPAKLYQKYTPKPEELPEEGDPERKGPLADYWQIHVPDAPGRNKHWKIPEFYAAHVAKRPIARLKPGVRMAWGMRALCESGVIPSGDLPAVRSVRLPEDGISKDSKTPLLYEGILYLVRLRLLYNPAETEHLFAYTFMRRWCDIRSDSTVRNGLKWLRENGYIKVVRRVANPGLKETLYYDLVAPSVSSLAKDKDAEGLIEVFRDFDRAVRDEALDELIKLGPVAVEPLIVTLTD